ncbi:MAG: homocysteine S-methyltransferase family protein, partial [OM182 bacterium]|nr:homocysteine S-methyltransferase family protein [OM182 bacterium]
MTEQLTRTQRVDALRAALTQRILLLDGAMGTMIQGYQLVESNFRGERFASTSQLLAGNNDLLTLTSPEIITEIHASYLAAG